MDAGEEVWYHGANQSRRPTMSETTPARATSNQSTEKAFAVLELLSEAQGPMRLRDISTALGLNSSTALRFVNALQNCGYAAQDPDTQRYYLTFKICRVANQMRSHTELLPIVRPFMEALFQEIHEALCLAVEQNMCMLYLDVRMRQNQRLMNMQQVGNSSPLHSTGIGKLLLLNYSEEQLDQMIARKGLTRYTEHTITTKAALLAELDKVRRQGYALDDEENEVGSRCMACPIRDYSGDIVAGISITGPNTRLTDEQVLHYLPVLSATAAQISAAFGYRGV